MFRMNKRNSFVALGAIALIFGLVGCNQTADDSATFINTSANSIYGTVSNFSVDINSDELKAGDVVTFVVTPKEDFYIDSVTVNGEACQQEIGSLPNTYSWTLVAGQNRLTAKFAIDKTVDIVDEFKLNIDESTYETVMNTDDYDFRENGIEEMNLDGYTYYVDGDTSHFTTKKESYTVKVRYLGIDTPESSSELEEWGKAASKFNQSRLESAKHVILQSQGRAIYETIPEGMDETIWSSDTDTYGRNLAYVWYTTEEDPELTDFRCLNIEMMFEGFSQGLGGSLSEMGEYFYTSFDKANLSAQANEKNYYSSLTDLDYYYGKPVDLELKDLYEDTTPGSTDSDYCDEYTLYRIHGYVSRKVENSYYIQDKASYNQSGSTLPEAYGIYVFTYSTNTLQVGDEVEVIGVLSSYGGSYQISGTSYRMFDTDEDRDTQIISSGNEIVPIELTAAQFEEQAYNNVLVKITDQITFVEDTNNFGVVNYGGSYEINTSGESEAPGGVIKYPFYYDDNQIITFGNTSGSTYNYRLKVTGEVLLSHGGQYSYSYKFFSGGTNLYSPNGAEYAYEKSDLYRAETDENGNPVTYIETVYPQRKTTSLTCISQNYVSTSGKTQKMQMLIVSRGDVTLANATN